jgi:hypothetical protein
MVAAVLASLLLAHASATCSQYPNQAAAQRAADTRDADGDGIYCEDLPCPCLKPGAPPPKRVHRHRLGPSKRLGPVTKTAGCHVHGGLPDPGCTPGVVFVHATRRDICAPGYSSRVRNVGQAQKDAVYAMYGFEVHLDGADGEIDHLVPLELGGTNARANLFPESASPYPGSHEKDQLENALHEKVCSGALSLRRAQREIARDWVAAFKG